MLGIAVTVGRHFQLGAALPRRRPRRGPVAGNVRGRGEDGADLGRDRLQQGVQHDAAQFVVGDGRGHVEGQAVEQRQVAAQGVARRRPGRASTPSARPSAGGTGVRKRVWPRRFLMDTPSGRSSLARQVGQLAHVLDEKEAGAAELHFVVGRQFAFALDGGAVESGAVEAVEVAEAPAAVGGADLGVFPTTEIVFEDDAVGGGPAEGAGLPRREREDVAEAVVPPDHEIGCRARGHGEDWSSDAPAGNARPGRRWLLLGLRLPQDRRGGTPGARRDRAPAAPPPFGTPFAL